MKNILNEKINAARTEMQKWIRQLEALQEECNHPNMTEEYIYPSVYYDCPDCEFNNVEERWIRKI